jgi:hypothetical protein
MHPEASLSCIKCSFKTVSMSEDILAHDDGRVDLSVQLSSLAEAIRSGSTVPAGRLYGLPELPGDNCWADMAGVAALTGVPPRTITSWLARGGPVRNPFPVPRRFLYRLYWPRDDIESWKERERGKHQRPPAP